MDDKTVAGIKTAYKNISNDLYIPISSHMVTFGLGVFKTEKEAENAYVEFLEEHYDFAPWIIGIKKRYKKLFNKEFFQFEGVSI